MPTSSIAASLLSLSIMAPPPVVYYYILQRGGSGGARQQPTGSKDASCQRHARLHAKSKQAVL